jgi:hypothetical protein
MLAPDGVDQGPDGQPRRVIPAIPLRSEGLDEAIVGTTMPYALEQVPRTGPQIMVTIEPGSENAKPSDLGLRYLVLSWLAPDRLPAFLRGLINAESRSLPPIQ